MLNSTSWVILFLVSLVFACSNVALSQEYKPYFSDKVQLQECYNYEECYKIKTLTKVANYTVKIEEFHWINDVSGVNTEAEAVILDEFGHIVAKHIGGWINKAETDPEMIAIMPPWADNVDTWYRPNNIAIVDTPDGFPFLVFFSSNYSPSNISHTYTLYSVTPSLEKKGEIEGIINEYQANKGKGNERNVVGFYQNRFNHEYLIDRLTTRGQDVGASNASQKYSAETFKITNEGLEPVYLRNYDFESYKPMD